MTDILKELTADYCEELNATWLSCMILFSPKEADFSVFEPFFKIAKEAWADGYTFRVQCEAPEFIREKIIGTSDEDELVHFPGWEPAAHIGKLLEDAEKKGQQWSISYLAMMKSHYTRQVMHAYALDYVERKGPFYMTDDFTCIHAFPYTGHHITDMAFISFLAPQLNNHGSTRTVS